MMTDSVRYTAARALFAMAALVALGGCATKGDIRNLQTELIALSARQDSVLDQLRMEAISTQDTLRTQSNQIFDFRGDINRQLRLIGESLNQIEALAGENQRGIRSIRDQVSNMGTQRQTVPRSPVSDSSAVVGGAAPGGGNADQLYETARDQMNRGSMTTARMAFEEFLRSHPNHELAPDAQFNLAHVLKEQGELDEALAAFGEVQTRHPTAERVPDALYRMALIHIERDDDDEAIDLLERVINTYPDALIAEIAAEKLAEIR
jgi:tol-pal system protein YbgF